MEIYLVLEYDCTCTFTDCKLVTHEERKELFTDFWKLDDFDAQNFNIVQNITLLPKKTQVLQQSKDKQTRPKTNTMQYFLNKKRVRKEDWIEYYKRKEMGKSWLKMQEENMESNTKLVTKWLMICKILSSEFLNTNRITKIKRKNGMWPLALIKYVYEMWKENSEIKFQNPKTVSYSRMVFKILEKKVKTESSPPFKGLLQCV